MADLGEAYALRDAAAPIGTPLAPLIPERLQPMETVRERIAQLNQEQTTLLRTIEDQETYFQTVEDRFQAIHTRLDEAGLETVHSTLESLHTVVRVALDEKQATLDTQKKAVAVIQEEMVLLQRFVRTCLLTVATDAVGPAAVAALSQQHNRCPICMEAEINRCLVPCGHTFCSRCSQRILTCPVCRGEIASCIPLYVNL